MHHLETLIHAIPPAVFAAGGAQLAGARAQSSPEPGTTPVAPFMYPTQFPSGVPPPSLHVFPLTNPSTHFVHDPNHDESPQSPSTAFRSLLGSSHLNQNSTPEQLAEEASRMSLAGSYLYFDDEGYTRWQGETSGLPVLDLLVERHNPSGNRESSEPTMHPDPSVSSKASSATNTDWFPNRTPRRTADVNPQMLWRLITSSIVPELMDRYTMHTLALSCS